MNQLLLAYYGDDFTGSTDALECITNAGAKAILFTEPPSSEDLGKFPDIDAYGIAGKTRALSPEEMEKELLRACEKMKFSGAKQIHYKVCSTFDSSDTIGSIGKAIDCGAAIFGNNIIPVLGGNPVYGRFCVFGNLFAKMGIGSEGKIFRLDRHPSMSKHPSTPMLEADLSIHLGKQTQNKIALVNYLQQSLPIEEWMNHSSDEKIVLLDTISKNILEKTGYFLNYLQKDSEPLFSVGSSSIEMALGKFWNKEGVLVAKEFENKIEKANPLLVVSGSCSPVTKNQIAFAKANGFEEIIIDAIKICDGENIDVTIIQKMNAFLSNQKNVIVHTGDKEIENLSSEKLGTALGIIAKNAVETSKIKRVIVAGGDTSSYAARAMEIDAVEMIGSMVVGAPLCKAYSKNKWIEGLEVNFKGGQVGSEDYFCKF